ncbi:MAG: TRAP transporter TatT component family protein [Myxococcota bacterium]|jgi:hypothetical protein|nr:TRAP transporter TatT component family protein [Myxococcota bacterium]
MTYKRLSLWVAVFVAMSFGLMGCNMKRLVINSSYALVEEATAAFFAEPDSQLAREAAPANLKLIEGMVKGSPKNQKLKTAAAQLLGAYAFGFLEDCCSDEAVQAAANERARALYLRSRDYAVAALDLELDFSGMLRLDQIAFEKALEELDENSVAPLFWATFSWGLYINLSRSDLSALAELSRVAAMARRVAVLDPSYFYGGADMFIMVLNSSMGPAVGGSPALAQQAYERAMKSAGGKFLLTKYLFAKHYTQQTMDRPLFEKLLREILEASADLLPEQRLSNQLAKEKATRLLAQADELF